MNMFKTVKADSIASYIAALPEEHKAPIKALASQKQHISPGT